LLTHQSRFATPVSTFRCVQLVFHIKHMAENLIQFVWERPESTYNGGCGVTPRSMYVLRPPWGAGSPGLGPQFRPTGVSKGPGYSNALRCACTPVPRAKTFFDHLFLDEFFEQFLKNCPGKERLPQ
jgi:hypothetical protein